MIRTLFKVTVCGVALLGANISLPAQAQECDYVYEVIATLRKPVIGSYNLWDTVYGEVNVREDIRAVVNTPDKEHVILAAERLEGIESQPELVLAEIDLRGRPVWAKRHKIEGMETIVTMIQHDEHFIVLGNKTHDQAAQSIWLGVFDRDGEKLDEIDIAEAGVSLDATSLIPSHDENTLLLAASKTDMRGINAISSLLNWVDLESKQVTRQVTFAMGADNQILDIIPLGKSQYMAAGGIREPDGRWSGWLANLNKEGGFIWQRNMARGQGGRFSLVQSLNDQYVVLAGEVLPSGDQTKKAAWVAAVNAASSDIAWQRYYRDSYNLQAVGLETSDDGQIAVLINASGSDNKDEFDFARLLTLNPRGAVLASDGYYNGVGASVTGLLSGKNKERIMYGSTDIAYKVERVDPKTKEKTENTLKNHQGWIVAGSPADTYQDPCRPVINYLE